MYLSNVIEYVKQWNIYIAPRQGNYSEAFSALAYMMLKVVTNE